MQQQEQKGEQQQEQEGEQAAEGGHPNGKMQSNAFGFPFVLWLRLPGGVTPSDVCA